MMGARIVALLTLVALFGVAAGVLAAAPVSDDAVRDVASQLRCVVCQSLSVADSPSETAHQMREIIRDRLAAGETPAQIITYFVAKYGDWILLAPPARGFGLLVWVVPYIGLLAGLVLVVFVVTRWNRRPPESTSVGARAVVDDETRQRIRREVAELDRE